MSALHEVCTLTEIESTQQPIHVNGVVRPPWWFFSVDDTLLVYKDKITTSSFTHSSSIVQLAVTPDNTLIFFVDNQGRLNLFSPNENLGLFSLCEFGKIRKLQLIATSLDQFSLLLVTEENILYWKALDTALFSSALDGGKTQYFAELLHRVVKLPCSSNSQVACALIGGTTDIVEISIPNDLTWLTGCAKPVTEQIRDPLEHLNFHSKFKKSVMIPQTGYCLALSADGLLFLFNLVAELCLGPIQAFSGILDFSIEPLTHPNEAEAEDTVNLPECGLILLRSADENDKPLTGDADSEVQSLILETFIFPSLERLNKIHVAVTSWLLSDSDLGEFKATDADYSTDNVSQVLFAEFLQSICSGSDSPRESEPFVRIRILQTVDAIQGVYRLLKEFRFSEARHLVQEYRLASNIYQKVVTAELRWLLLTLLGTSPHQQSDSTSSMKASDSSAPHGKKSPGEICDRILVCLDEVECIWPIHDLLERFLEVCMPTPGMQMKLLLSLKEKLFADKQSNEIEFEKYSVKIYSILKRLKAFLLLNGPERFSPSTWKTFLGSSIYTLFAFFLTTDGSIQPREIPCDPSKAFLIWNLYKNDLIKLLNQEALNLMCDSLSRRSLTFTPHPDQEFETQKQIFIESETAIHRWLRNELFPAVINRCPQSIHLIINFVIRRVKQLEAHSSVNETPDLAASGVSVCPFSWPDFAISWTEGFLNAVSLTSGGSETVYLTPGDKVKAYMTGLGSLDPKVDPLGDLRKLAKQLRTIETLRKVYGCRLSLANCDAQTELSIAYRILDIPFNLGMSLSGGVDGLTAKYLEDRKIDLETFHQGYALDLCRRIKVALEQSDSVIGFDYNTQPIDPSPSAESESHAHDPKALVLQACVVAEWITVPLCRIKVVYKLASLAPLPWPKELLQLVDKVLSHARANKLLHSKPVTYGRAIGLSHFKYAARMHQLSRLERLVSIARVQEILSRYSLSSISCVEIDSDVSIDIARHAVCCIMYNFSNPFSVRSATNTFDTSVPKMNEQVLRDSATIARELIVCEEWAVWFARVRMQIITEMASDLSILDENTPDWEEFRQSILEQRVSFVLDQLDESTECLYSALVGDSNQDSRPGKIPPPHHLIKRFLGLNCLRSIEFTLRLLPFNESSQICILLELAIAISQTIIWTENEHTSPLSSGCSVDLVQSSSFSIWLYQHSDNIQHALDVVHLIGSIRQLALSSLSERCHLVQLLTSCWVRQKNVGGLRLVYDGNLPLRNAYDQVLPDVNRSNREELLLWNWTTASLESLCEMVDDPKAETSFETSSTTLRSICTSLIENLQSITQQSETKTPRNSCSAQKRLAPPTASASVLSACPFCMRLWNSPLGRLGCVLQLWHDSVFPLVTQILSRASNLTSDDVNYVLSAVSYSLHTLFLLVFRSVGHSGSKVSKLGKDCTCQIQSLRPQIQGLLQILQAYDVSFSALTNACSSTVSDPLNRWTFSSMFSETPFGTVDLPLNCSIESLSWLSNLFGWLLRLNARSCDGNSPGTLSLPNENRLNALERLADVSMDLASIWSTQYGLRLKMAVPLLYGAHRLLFHKTKCDLWTEENNRTPNSGSALLNSPKLSQNFRERWSLLCTRCFVAALETTLNPTEGKYLDQTLVLGLALSVPIEDATTIVRSVVASSRDAPKKIKAIASIMYIFSLVAPERGSNFLHTSISMAKLWSWKAGLKPYGLNLSHLVAGGESAESYAVVLNKLCRIVPSPEQRSGSAPVGVLLPSDTSCVDGPRFSKTDNSSDRARLLPPIRILVNFARDFQLPLRIALMSHLKSLFLSTSGNSLTSTTNQPVPSFDFPGLDGFAGLTTESFVAKQKESNAEKLRFW
ncbi:hypothetical protein D915_008369 [Fasciola hepatica]|uniref:KNTC1 first ARM-repeats domain-containing protein n=1 Tax=Fasciola hepatica TaxID=6192 RepID=A0A4E0RJ74_FASHE|nr:hypothetical protein D915_008369 [Fasciola hepatica]